MSSFFIAFEAYLMRGIFAVYPTGKDILNPIFVLLIRKFFLTLVLKYYFMLFF